MNKPIDKKERNFLIQTITLSNGRICVDAIDMLNWLKSFNKVYAERFRKIIYKDLL